MSAWIRRCVYNTHTHIYIYICIHIYIHICRHIYIYIQTHAFIYSHVAVCAFPSLSTQVSARNMFVFI